MTRRPGRGELLARCGEFVDLARRLGRTDDLYRCPACQDTGWVFATGTTVRGGEGVPVAARCHGPTATGCAYTVFEQERRARLATPTPKPARGRMD